MNSQLWLLPEGIEELLPDEAERMEALRRKALDVFSGWGYRLVVPPMVEFLNSLLTGAGSDLDLQTFKVTDQLSGRLMGIRADMTPQVARLDARSHADGGPNRLSYSGSVLRTRARDYHSSRSPLQTGCELFGVADLAADIEVVSVMLDTLYTLSAGSLHLDLSHVGIAARLIALSGLDHEVRQRLGDALARRSLPDVDEALDGVQCSEAVDGLRAIAASVYDRNEFGSLNGIFEQDTVLSAACQDLRLLSDRIRHRFPQVDLTFDLCEMRGYHYHTGIVFSVFTEGSGRAVAEGGRYDGVGSAFGQARPATGFSMDLRHLLWKSVREGDRVASPGMILAPETGPDGYWSFVAGLRAEGHRVRVLMPGEARASQLGCDREIICRDGRWTVQPLAEC